MLEANKTPEIIYEDNHLIAINKPFGMPSQGDKTGDLCAFDWVKEYIRVTYKKPGKVYLALPHRLDRPTGGILLMVKTSKAASRISKQFHDRNIQKTYLAITEKTPENPNGHLKHYLRKLPQKNIVRAYNKNVHSSKEAVLDYRVLMQNNGRALIEVLPHTGRRHQIRVQLAALGCTIKGDVKYGKTKFNSDKSICLLAQQLTLEHPVKKEKLSLKIPIPQNAIWEGFSDYTI